MSCGGCKTYQGCEGGLGQLGQKMRGIKYITRMQGMVFSDVAERNCQLQMIGAAKVTTGKL